MMGYVPYAQINARISFGLTQIPPSVRWDLA